jgi:hypothetical protein
MLITAKASTRPMRKRAIAPGLLNSSEKAAIDIDSTGRPRLVGSTWK